MLLIHIMRWLVGCAQQIFTIPEEQAHKLNLLGNKRRKHSYLTTFLDKQVPPNDFYHVLCRTSAIIAINA